MIGRVLLFLSSYAALWLILSVSFWGSWVSYVCLGLGILSVVVIFGWLNVDRNQSGDPYSIESVEDAGSEAAGYLASYLLPFFNVDSPGIRDVVVYVGFFIVAGAIYVNSSIMRINPTLYLAGYRVYDIKDRTGRQHYLISRRQLFAGDEVLAIDKRGGILIYKKLTNR